jgi:hypothetical protein
MAEQLKIVIDADVTRAVSGVQNLSKVISSDFTRATNLAASAASSLSTEVNNSVQKINAALSSLKVTSLDVNVNTSTVDASIKSIQSKFAALVDPEVNVLANTALAEAKIKELLSDLASLKGSEVFIKANDAQALSAIAQIETELRSLSDKSINLKINSGDAIQKVQLLEKELLDLQSLSVAPNISSTQLSVFEANIKRIKAEIASLKGQGIVVPIGIDTAKAQANLNILSESIETLRGKAEARKFFITTETDITKIAAYNKEIQLLEARIRQIQNVGKRGFELFVVPNQTINSVKSLTASVAAFGGGVKTFIPPAIAGFNKLPSSISPIIGSLKALERQAATSGAAVTSSFGKAFGGLRSLAALIPGIGLGGIIGLAATAVNSLTEGFFEAAFGASKLDKAIDAAAGSIDKNAASVITMVKALQSGTLTSSEFKKVKAELIAQAPEFQNAFEGNKIKVGEADIALQKYIKQLTTTIRVTAALGIVNETLAKSIAVIAKGGEVSFGQQILSFFEGFGDLGTGLRISAEKGIKSINDAQDALKPENISKLLDDTFKKLGISFSDFASTVDDKALKDKLAKLKAEFEKFQTETIARARQFTKEFGASFVLPNLEDSFFKSKAELFKASKDLLESVRKFLAGDQKALQIKIPLQFEAGQITETITKDVQKLNQVIGSLQPLKLTTQGDFKEVINQLGVLNNKEITLTINQEGDVEKIAKQLADLNLRGVEIPIVIEQQGDIKKIAEQLSKLKAVDIKITGDAQKVLTDLSKIKDVSVSVKLDQTGALDKLTELTKGKQLPIFINEDGIITQITRAVDGAIKVVQTRAIRVPVITEADIKIAENLSKEIELSQAILDNFFKSIERDVRVPVNLIPDPTLSKQAIDDINKKLNLKEQFKIFGDLGLSEFEKIDFSNINRGIAEATDRLRGMFEVANTLNQAIGQGLVGAFNSVFDAILEGKNVFKALANGIKDLIIQTIKAVAQMLILKAVTSFLFPGAGAGGFSLPKGQFVLQANPGNTGFGGIGSRAFTNTLNVVVTGQISNQSILLAGQRALGSNSR